LSLGSIGTFRTLFPFDTVQMPLNAMDRHFYSFTQQVPPKAYFAKL
jgi:hypothetical protein